MTDLEKEVDKIKKEIAKEKQFNLLKVYEKHYKFPEEKELLHIAFLDDFYDWIQDDKKLKKLISLLEGTIKSLKKL